MLKLKTFLAKNNKKCYRFAVSFLISPYHLSCNIQWNPAITKCHGTKKMRPLPQPSTASNQKPRCSLYGSLSVTLRKTGFAAQFGPPSAGAYLCSQLEQTMTYEGWHHSLNRRAAGRCGLPLYMFVALLYKEAGLVSVQIHLVEHKLKRMQRATYCEVQRWLFELWEVFNKKEKSLKQLLKGCANINRPVMH